MNPKWISMLLMAVAIYLTVILLQITVNLPLYVEFIDMSQNSFVLLRDSIAIVTVFLYLTAFSLLYFTYRGQFRVTWNQVLGFVGLQSLVVALWCTGVSIIYGVYLYLVNLRLYPNLYSLWAYSFWSYTLYLVIIGAFLLAGLCFVIRRGYRHSQVRKHHISIC
jgi:phosphate starvation-inducible membrane PsiE